MTKKITIIGGSGFVGTHLAQILSLKQYNFEIIDLKMSKKFSEKCKIADVRNIESLRQTITGDIIVNLAAVHRDDIRDETAYQNTNVDGAQNIATVCLEKDIKKIVFTSTVAVYGMTAPDTDETGQIKPFNEYGRTKFSAEERLREWQRASDNSLIIVRPTVIFGPGNRGNVYNLLKQIASGKFLMVGNGKNYKSMAYIENVVAFLEHCISTDKKYALINYVDTPDLTMNKLVSHVRWRLQEKKGPGVCLPYWMAVLIGCSADILARLMKKNLPISYIRIKKFTSTSKFQSAKETLDDFDAPYALLDGIEKTLHNEFIAPDLQQEIFYTE